MYARVIWFNEIIKNIWKISKLILKNSWEFGLDQFENSEFGLEFDANKKDVTEWFKAKIKFKSTKHWLLKGFKFHLIFCNLTRSVTSHRQTTRYFFFQNKRYRDNTCEILFLLNRWKNSNWKINWKEILFLWNISKIFHIVFNLFCWSKSRNFFWCGSMRLSRNVHVTYVEIFKHIEKFLFLRSKQETLVVASKLHNPM